MSKKLTGREKVAAAARDAGWTLIADGAIDVDTYRLGRKNVFVSCSVTGAVTTASTPNGIIGSRLTGKAGRVANFLRVGGTAAAGQR